MKKAVALISVLLLFPLSALQKAMIEGRDALDIAIPELTKFSGRKGQPLRLEFAV